MSGSARNALARLVRRAVDRRFDGSTLFRAPLDVEARTGVEVRIEPEGWTVRSSVAWLRDEESLTR